MHRSSYGTQLTIVRTLARVWLNTQQIYCALGSFVAQVMLAAQKVSAIDAHGLRHRLNTTIQIVIQQYTNPW